MFLFIYYYYRYCENGSLANMCKKFGKFPENLAAVYISQVLKGLAFLHDQGTIHRDIKGANILTTKEGNAKLADFGVATKINKLEENQSVVGTPNWMAPEVIELNGATTASDIWSLGCTVIELLTGNPPFHTMSQMQALFAIVNNDHPPIPEGVSPIVQDFLIQCFQKDHNLRVSAKKLLKHPWITNAKNPLHNGSSSKFDDAVKTVQKWNQAINHDAPQITKVSKRNLPQRTIRKASIHHDNITSNLSAESSKFESLASFSQSRRLEFKGMLERNKIKKEVPSENWDEDFADEDISSKLQSARSKNKSDRFQDRKTHTNSDSLSSSSSEDFGMGDHGSGSVIKHPKTTPSLLGTPKVKTSLGKNLLGIDSPFKDSAQDDFSDLIGELDIAKLPSGSSRAHFPCDITRMFSNQDRTAIPKTPSPEPESAFPSPKSNYLRNSAIPSPETSPNKAMLLNSFQEKEEDFDYSGMFGGQSYFELKQSQGRNSSHIDDDENDSDDPFAGLEDSYTESDIEDNIAREKLAYAQSLVESILNQLNKDMRGHYLYKGIRELWEILYEFPETSKTITKHHGLLLLLDVLDIHVDDKVLVPNLLQIIFTLLEDNDQNLENFCLVGGIPLVAQFTSKKYTNEIRLQAAMFIVLLYKSDKYGLPMFLACGGLHILAKFIEEDGDHQPKLVTIGVNGIWSVFEHQGSAPRNDICRNLSKNAVLDSLSRVLIHLLRAKRQNDFDLIDKIVSIFVYFSQTESHVKFAVANRRLFCNVFKAFPKLSTKHQLSMLKFVKNMSSMPEILPKLQNSNAIDILTRILSRASSTVGFKDYANQILHTMYNLCKLSKSRQEEAATAGIIPVLQKAISAGIPLKEFALPILCDMAHAGRVCRSSLWQHHGLDTYLKLTCDPYWQVKAYEAIATWLQEDFAKVEEELLSEKSIKLLLEGLKEARGTFFDAVLEPLQKVMRCSPAICNRLAEADLLILIKKQLDIPRPMLRLNLLRLVRTILEYHPSKTLLVKQTGLYHSLQLWSESDDTVLVKELAKELINCLDSNASSRFNSAIGRTSSDDYQNDIVTSSVTSRRYSFMQSPTLSEYNIPVIPNLSNRSNASSWQRNIRDKPMQSILSASPRIPMSPTRHTKHKAHASLINPSHIMSSPAPSYRDDTLHDIYHNYGSHSFMSPGSNVSQKLQAVMGTPSRSSPAKNTLQSQNYIAFSVDETQISAKLNESEISSPPLPDRETLRSPMN